MASPLSADMLTAVEDWAVDFCITVLKGVAEEMQVDGYVYGDVKLGREQRILAFEQMDASGELSSLATVNPSLAKQYADQYQRDTTQQPVYTGKV